MAGSPRAVDQSRPSDATGTVVQLPATLVRGGTSKCWIFRQSDLPADIAEVERLLIRTFGSPDLRQIDGVGGASSTTSKAIVVSDTESAREGVVEYRFAQIAVDKASVEWGSNCGNCATGLGLYALHAGLVQPAEELSRVPIFNTVTGLSLVCEIPTPGGRVPTYGQRRLPGQFYPGIPVDIIFEQDSWSSFGPELPTGRPFDHIILDGTSYRATLIDAGAPAALFDASDLGLTGQEEAPGLRRLASLAPGLRAAAAKSMNIPAHLSSIPKVGVVGSPPPGEHGVSARMMSMGALHPAIGLTSAVAIAAASGRQGSVVNRYFVRPEPMDAAGHTMSIHVLNGVTDSTLDAAAPTKVSFQRSARVISQGTVLVPED